MKKTALSVAALIGLLLAQSAVAATPVKYLRATRDASVVEAGEIVNTLDALSPDNNSLVWNSDKTRLKVVTWKSQSSYALFLQPYPQTSGSEDFVIWVTLAPKIQDFCRQFLAANPKATKAQLNLRLKQYLGLNPAWQYDVFVELWVNPEDVFRPCVDPDPTDKACELDFGAAAPIVKNIPDYPAFYKNLYYKSFRSPAGVPWTGLGYTYDWKQATQPRAAFEQGASEFILSPSTPYIIEHAVPTFEYCQP